MGLTNTDAAPWAKFRTPWDVAWPLSRTKPRSDAAEPRFQNFGLRPEDIRKARMPGREEPKACGRGARAGDEGAAVFFREKVRGRYQHNRDARTRSNHATQRSPAGTGESTQKTPTTTH